MPNDGNDRIRETDARGHDTLYTADPDTSRVTDMTDRCGVKTSYVYDDAGRTTGMNVYNGLRVLLSHVGYEYDVLDNLTGITRNDGMKYVLTYNDFHKLSSIKINVRTSSLASYEYKDGNGRLKKVMYANGTMMKLSYNRMGQVISEKWYKSNNTLAADYGYVYNGRGELVSSIDKISKTEYDYMYENDRLTYARECRIMLDQAGMVTHKFFTCGIRYAYDSEGRLVKKTVSPAYSAIAGTVTEYTHDDKYGTSASVKCGSTSYTSHSGTDGFGRKDFDEIQTGYGFITRQYTYHKGAVTDEHTANGKVKSGPVTGLVKRIDMSDGRSLTYEYDNEERIIRITETDEAAPGDPVITTYTYDALGQLTHEVRGGVTVNEMTYDSCGIIYGGNAYYFLKNLQGDIISIRDSQNNSIAKYLYDAWGACTVVSDKTVNGASIATVNPFRYRGYYYDTDTGLYYLQSRYYDPVVGRFINADEPSVLSAYTGILSYNLYAYCENEPINRYDTEGLLWKKALKYLKAVIRFSSYVFNKTFLSYGIDTARIGAYFLEMFKDKNGIYHARFDCWQQYFGYNDLYDIAFGLSTSMNNKKFEFDSGGKSYVIWAWKGDYMNLGAGVELGIYHGGKIHWFVDKNLAMHMSLTLKYKGKTIISYSARTWWITGFNPKYLLVNDVDLEASFTVSFNSAKMYKDFKDRWKGKCRFIDKNKTVIIKF